MLLQELINEGCGGAVDDSRRCVKLAGEEAVFLDAVSCHPVDVMNGLKVGPCFGAGAEEYERVCGHVGHEGIQVDDRSAGCLFADGCVLSPGVGRDLVVVPGCQSLDHGLFRLRWWVRGFLRRYRGSSGWRGVLVG